MATHNAANPVMELVQVQLETSRQLADAVFAGTEKLDRMMFDVTHRAFDEQMRLTRAAMDARDPASMARLQSSFLTQPEAISNYQKQVLQVLAQMQSEIGESVQQYVKVMMSRTAEAANAAGSAAGTATGQGNAGGNGMGDPFSPVSGMFSVWQSAFREVSAMANRNMEAARSRLAETMTSAGAAAANAPGHEHKGAAGSRRK